MNRNFTISATLTLLSVFFAASPASAALPSWRETVDFTTNLGTRVNSGVDCLGDGIIGNCEDLSYTLSDMTLTVSGRVYSSTSDTTGTKAYVEKFNSLGVKGLGVDSGVLTDFRDSVDDFESLVLTFSKKTSLFGWTMTDVDLSGGDSFSLRVDGGIWTNYTIGNRATQEIAILEGTQFEFISNNDSFVLQSVVVPEPETIALALAGLAVLGMRRVKSVQLKD